MISKFRIKNETKIFWGSIGYPKPSIRCNTSSWTNSKNSKRFNSNNTERIWGSITAVIGFSDKLPTIGLPRAPDEEVEQPKTKTAPEPILSNATAGVWKAEKIIEPKGKKPVRIFDDTKIDLEL